jgi:hypothetical protein
VPNDLSARLIVMDTGPLITLAVADSLDYLLYPGVPVYLPDAVLYEATRDSAILAWVHLRSEQVLTISTETFFNYVQSREANPGRREKDLGERSALEAIHDGMILRRTNGPFSSPKMTAVCGVCLSPRRSLQPE